MCKTRIYYFDDTLLIWGVIMGGIGGFFVWVAVSISVFDEL